LDFLFELGDFGRFFAECTGILFAEGTQLGEKFLVGSKFRGEAGEVGAERVDEGF